MRELTWNEKLLDQRYYGAITKWCQAIEETISNVSSLSTEEIRIYPVENHYEERYEKKVFKNDELYSYKVLPLFKGEWTKIVLKLADENYVALLTLHDKETGKEYVQLLGKDIN